MTTETAALPKPFIPTTEGCYVDPNALFLSVDGTAVELLEWAPASAFSDRATFTEARAAAAQCALALGGWKVPSPKEWVGSGIDYTKEDPASNLPDAESDWFWTDQVDPSSPADGAFFVYLRDGHVLWDNQLSRGRVRFCRRVRASQYLILGS